MTDSNDEIIFWVVLTFCLAACITAGDLEPLFIADPQSSTVQFGDRASLYCGFGPVGVGVQWLYNGSLLSDRLFEGIEIKFESIQSIVDFKSIRYEHGGLYQCRLNSSLGSIVSPPAQLTVFSSDASSPSTYDVNILAGNVATIRCFGQGATSKTSVTVEFDFNGSRLPRSGRRKILPTGNLQISKISIADAGQYRCFSIDMLDGRKRTTLLSTTQLNVTASSHDLAPRFTWVGPQEIEVIEGGILTLECVAEGRPVPHIMWLRYGGSLPQGRYQQILGNLVINNVQGLDEGTYICQAENAAGPPQIHVVFVEVLQSPSIIKPPESQNISEGGRVALSCRARGYPRPSVVWFHNTEEIKNSSESLIVDSRLILSNIKRNQSGILQCLVSNSAGTVSASASLVVIGRTSTNPVVAGQASSSPTVAIDQPSSSKKKKVPTATLR